jgi:hypothetical protein
LVSPKNHTFLLSLNNTTLFVGGGGGGAPSAFRYQADFHCVRAFIFNFAFAICVAGLFPYAILYCM